MRIRHYMRWDTLIIWGLNFAMRNPIAALVVAAAVFIFISVNSQPPAYVYKPQPPSPPRPPFDMTMLAIENVKIEPAEPCCTWQYGVSRAVINLDITNNSASRELETFGAKVTVRDCDKSNKCVVVGEASTYGYEHTLMQRVNIEHGNKRHEQWELYFSDMPRQPEGQSRIIDHEFYAEGY